MSKKYACLEQATQKYLHLCVIHQEKIATINLKTSKFAKDVSKDRLLMAEKSFEVVSPKAISIKQG